MQKEYKNCKYISRKEIKEYKKEIEEAILEIKKATKENYKKSFNHMIVGSARRNLIIQRKDGKWDVDYQLKLDSPIFSEIDPKYIKTFIQNEFKKFLGNDYNVKLSTSVITLSSKKEDNKSFDIALVRKNKDQELEILRGKEKEDFKWELIKNSKPNQIKEIRGDDWRVLRNIFLSKKCENYRLSENNKKETYSLLLESIKETLDKIYNY